MNIIIGVAIRAIIPVTADPTIMKIIRYNMPNRSPHTAAITDIISANGIISIESIPNHASLTLTKLNLTPPIIGAKTL